jgi:hypothetical protein
MTLTVLHKTVKVARQVGPTQVALYALYKLGLKTGHYQRITPTPDPRKQNLQFSNLVSLFSLPGRDPLKHTLGEDGLHALLAEADEISAGVFRMFGGKPVPLHLTGDWPLVHWTLFESGVFKIEGDIKFIWEPARFGWAFILGRAYHLTQNETYAKTFWEYFDEFIEANPPYLGPHWMNGQEVAIRLMALVWAGQVFETAAASSRERRVRLARSIAAHAFRIPPTLVYARAQNNNHLVTEAAGLYTAGLALPDHPDATDWRALGWRWLNWAFQHQISGYGEYIQHSTNYHRVMLQTALWVNAIKEDDWPHLTLQSLGRAAHWLFSMLDPASGQIPNLGANDGALILPLSVAPFDDFRPTVQATARAFLRFQMPGGRWDEMSLWLGLHAHEKAYESNLYMADHLRGTESWAYLRATQFRSRLGHMDQLHLDLWWRGLNIAQDAGTYLYNANPPWDNPLVGSRVHNTVTVDGRDQMTRGGRFINLDWFPAYSRSVVAIDESALGQMMAYHNGYPAVRHERTVTVYAGERWVVEDHLASQKPHTYRLHWLLPDWEWGVETGHERIEITLISPHGRIALLLRTDPLFSSLKSLFSLVRAGKIVYGNRAVMPYEGWVSPTYGIKEPALSLAFEVKSIVPIQFRSEFKFHHED